MEKLYTVSNKKDLEMTVAQIMTSLCKIQVYTEKSKENQ